MAEVTVNPEDLILTTDKLLKPQRISIATGTGFSKQYVYRPVFVISLSSTPPTEIDYTPFSPTGDTGTLKEHHTARGGMAFLYAKGWWWVRHNAAGAESFVMVDAGGAGLADAVAGASSSSVGDLVNVASIGGTGQTGLNLTGLFTAKTMASPSTATVGAASGQILAADSARRFVYVRNTHASQRVSLAFGVAAVLDSGITLKSDEWVSFDSATGYSTQEIRAIAAGAGTTVALQTGT